jgi:hypothetical protein
MKGGAVGSGDRKLANPAGSLPVDGKTSIPRLPTDSLPSSIIAPVTLPFHPVGHNEQRYQHSGQPCGQPCGGPCGGHGPGPQEGV